MSYSPSAQIRHKVYLDRHTVHPSCQMILIGGEIKMGIVKGTHLIYSVSPGDTLYSIASRFGSSVDLITQSNALYPPITDPGFIYPSQKLVMPTSFVDHHQVFHIVQPGDSLFFIAERYSSYPDLLAGLNPEIQNPNVIFPEQQIRIPAFIYEVESGDTLRNISSRLGISLAAILKANQERPGFSADLIYPGFRLIVPLPTSANIAVIKPFPGESIEDGERIAGFARVFEATVLHQVRDQNDVIVSNERFAQANIGAPAYGYFESSLTFDRHPTASEGELWVYTRSAKDGSIQDLVQLNIYFE